MFIFFSCKSLLCFSFEAENANHKAAIVTAINIVRFAVKYQATKSLHNFPYKSIVGFVLLFSLPWLLCALMESTMRKRVVDFLNNVSPDVTLSVNGQFIRPPDQIIAELKKIRDLPAHHSHATKRIHIEVVDRGESLVLELGRDSRRMQEYWVFYPGYRYTSGSEIGRIVTSLFDSY